MSESFLKGSLSCGLALALVAMAAAYTPAPAAAAPEAPTLTEMPCPPDEFPPEADITCGTITVPEKRLRPDGRTITVAAAVVHASSPHPKPDPIVFLPGGPSFGGVSGFSSEVYFGGASFVEDRDVILVDTRGTGLSEPRLGCPEFDDAGTASAYSQPYVDADRDDLFHEAVAACRDRLTDEGIDLSAYTSAESAADLHDLRQALGVRTWNLVTASADGILGRTYMRLFPGDIRSAVLDSTQSPTMLGAVDYARGNKEVLERVFAGCRSNAACDAKYPDIRALFLEQVAELQRHPLLVTNNDFEPQPVTFRVGVWAYRDAVYNIFPGNLFEPERVHDLLDEIWRSTHGELADVIREREGSGPIENDTDSFLAEGKTMSYWCHDVVAFVTDHDLRKGARDVPPFAPDILDPDYDLPFGRSGCAIWGVGRAEREQHNPPSSRIPTLVLAGEFDSGGGVPPLITRQLLPKLPKSYYFELPASPHLQLASYNTASDCARGITTQFLDAPQRRPDAACIGQLARFDFTPP